MFFELTPTRKFTIAGAAGVMTLVVHYWFKMDLNAWLKAMLATSRSAVLPIADAPSLPFQPAAEAAPQVSSKVDKAHEFPLTSPTSVNYHMTRQCNFECAFCFHTAKTSFVATLEDAKKTLQALADHGMVKINFAGGEPFLTAKLLGQLCKFCKMELHLASVSIVTNGSLVTRKWLEEHGKYVDIIAVSCDSFNEETNRSIGRRWTIRSKENVGHIETVFNVADWCKEWNIRFKVNTVVCNLNVDESMIDGIKRLKPFRWKVFQVLPVEDENYGPGAKRQVAPLLISDEQYNCFILRHKSDPFVNGVMVRESNSEMRNSYLLLDEHLRFLNCSTGKKIPTGRILDIGVPEALRQVSWDPEMFRLRGGIFDWSKTSCSNNVDIEDA